jgi:predicted RNA binding protein YcfA (HicA-like mRNA interferase family)
MSRRIRSLRPSELIQLLEKAGWSQKRQTGSHVILVKEGHRSIPVPFHTGELKRGLQMAILKQAGLTPEDVENLLAD